MGGDYTETVEQPRKKKAKGQDKPEGKAGGIKAGAAEDVAAARHEFHVKGDEAHFHDRTAGTKVAVPYGTFLQAFRSLQSATGRRARWTYHDFVNSTILQVEWDVSSGKDPGVLLLEAAIEIWPMTLDPAAQALVNFFHNSLAGGGARGDKQ